MSHKTGVETTSILERLKFPALWLVILVLVLSVLFYILGINARYDSTDLTLVLNIIFVVIPSFFIAVIAARSFTSTGVWSVLWMGIGTLTFGLAVLISMWLRVSSSNEALTVYSIVVLIAGVFYLLGGFFALNRVPPHETNSGLLSILLQVYLSAIAFIILFTVISILGILPPFFVASSGGTPLRTVIQTIATFLFLFAGLMLFQQSIRSKSSLLHWYSLGLLLTCISMGGTQLVITFGTTFNWTLRVAQLLGGVYLFMAALTIFTESKFRQIPVAETMSEMVTHLEAKLKESEENFRTIVSTANEGIWVGDAARQNIYINEKMASMLGYSVKEMMAKSWTDIIPAEFHFLSDTNMEKRKQGIGDNFEIKLIHKDGTPRWFISNSVPRYDKDGKFAGAIDMFTDITERRKTEDALKESEAKANALIKYAPTGIYEIDFRGPRFLSVNDAMCVLTGYTREEMFAIGPVAMLDDDSKKLFADRIRRQLAGEKLDESVEYRVRKKDGSIIFVTLNISFSKNKPGTALVIGHDVTAHRQADAAVKESEEKYRMLFENMSEGFALCEMVYDDEDKPIDYRFINVNPLLEKFFGLTRDKIIGKTIRGILPNVQPKAIENFGKAVRTGEPIHFENYSRDLNRWFDVYTYKSGPGRFAYLLLDINQSKKVEETLKESEERFSKAFHSSPVALSISRVNDGTFIDVNRSFLTLFGYKREELVGQKATELNIYINPVDRTEIMRILKGQGSVLNYELTARTKNGNELKALVSAEVIEFKNETHIIWTTINISERKRAEEILRETSNYLNNLFDYANAPIIVWDPQFCITRFNHAFERLTGISAGEAIGKQLDVLFPEDSREHFMEHIRRVHIGQRMEVEEIPIIYKDGSVRTVLWNSATLYASDNKTIIATIAQGQDITERKKAEEELRQRTVELEASNKELEAFAYSVSHDLRAPLRSMGGFSSALMEDYSEKLDEQGKKYLTYIQESSNLMGQLIDDLLKLSRVTRSEMNRERVNLSQIALKVVDDLEKAEPDHQVKVTIAPNVTAYGDRNLLFLLLQNLVGNAWKFSSKNAEPRIEMGTITRNGKLTYFVRDNGVGFDMQYADKLFKPFQRLHKTEEFAGTGIGLATVQRIIRRHDGEVWAESKVGEGATFYFTLS